MHIKLYKITMSDTSSIGYNIIVQVFVSRKKCVQIDQAINMTNLSPWLVASVLWRLCGFGYWKSVPFHWHLSTGYVLNFERG